MKAKQPIAGIQKVLVIGRENQTSQNILVS